MASSGPVVIDFIEVDFENTAWQIVTGSWGSNVAILEMIKKKNGRIRITRRDGLTQIYEMAAGNRGQRGVAYVHHTHKAIILENFTKIKKVK